MKKKSSLRLWIIVAIVAVVAIIIVVPQYLISTTDDKPVATAPADKGAKGAKGGGKAIPVLVAEVVSERVLDGIPAVGSLRPWEQVEMTAETSGKVIDVLFDEGKTVNKGQVLLKINDDDLQAQLQRYEFQEKTLAEKLERQRILFSREAISQEQFDAVQTEYNVLRADMDLLRVKIARCVVQAPFAGTVGFRLVSLGAYITPGTPITTLVDLSRLRVEFSIPEKYNTMDLVGMKVFFTTPGSPVQNEAQIYAMEPQVDEKTRTIVLRASYNNASLRLRPGMTAVVTIPTMALVNRLLVPTEAIIPSMEGKSVWVVKDGHATSVNVATGVRLEKLIEVTRGLAVGDSVIITGLMQMREGAAVNVTN